MNSIKMEFLLNQQKKKCATTWKWRLEMERKSRMRWQIRCQFCVDGSSWCDCLNVELRLQQVNKTWDEKKWQNALFVCLRGVWILNWNSFNFRRSIFHFILLLFFSFLLSYKQYCKCQWLPPVLRFHLHLQFNSTALINA